MEQSNAFVEWIHSLLVWMGLSSESADTADRWISALVILLIVAIVDLIIRWGVLRLVRNFVKRTKATWDDLIFDRKVINKFCRIITPVLLLQLIPIAFPIAQHGDDFLFILISRLLRIYIVICCVRFINSVVTVAFELAEKRPALHGKPLKGLMQTVKVIVICIGVILVGSILIDESPAILLTGIGASAAVLMLVFQDSILGLVAGVQLSANNMLKVGDWISVPSRGIDGVVEEVALTTVKIRGWDNVCQSIPPYLLISEPFDNWQAMFDSGGRRVKRSLNIDMTSVSFVTPTFIESLQQNGATQTMINEEMQANDDTYSLTNLDLFMRCLNRYLQSHHKVNHKMLVLVRQLQPSQWGLPIELYFFSADTRWVNYEQLQAEVISHVVALAPFFGLKIYQAPASFELPRNK